MDICTSKTHAAIASATHFKVCPGCGEDLNIIRASTRPRVDAAALDAAALDALAELDDPLGNDDEDDEVAVVPMQETFKIPSGKYKGLELPRMIGVKPSYYDKVMQLKDEIVADPEFQRYASSIARTYAELRREAEVKAKALSDVKLRLTAVMLLMIDQFENESESGLTLANGDKVRWHTEPHLVVTDKEAFRQSCVKMGLEREMVLPWGKGNRILKDMLVAGEEVPDGAEMFARPKVSFTKGDK